MIYDNTLSKKADVDSLIKNTRCVFIEVTSVRKAMALLSAFHYGYPMTKAFTVAVTGTKGKTSTVTAVRDILNESPRFKAIILNDALPADAPHLTTPESIDLHAAVMIRDHLIVL